MPAVSKAQQRFMGMVRATQKGEMKNPSPEVADAAASMTKKDAKDFASTKHKGLPEKKEVKESTGEERFCMLCGKNEYKEECSYGPNMWNWFTVDKLSESIMNEEGLRDWFGKSKSKDGKKGWVNVVTGDSCASDKPGEGIPKCVSSSKRASMSKKERLAAAAAKRREDPGQQKKTGASKPTMVKTDRKVKEDYSNWRKDLAESYLRVQERGKTYSIILNWRGRTLQIQMFFAKFSRPTKDEVKAEIHKVYPNAIVLYYNPVPKDPTKPLLFAGERDEPRRN
tara:strand:- start:316 stop:1161 length:846 start_codon:yes stop_codon:yes gene_type:complete